MTEEQERAAFESWMRDGFFDGISDAGEWDAERNCYKEFDAHMAWKGWQARAAFSQPAIEEAVRLEREAILDLAIQKSATFPSDSDYIRGYALAKQDFSAAIRARSAVK